MLLCWTCVSSCVCAPWLGPFRRTPLALQCTEGSSRGASAIPLGGCRLYSLECREGFISETGFVRSRTHAVSGVWWRYVCSASFLVRVLLGNRESWRVCRRIYQSTSASIKHSQGLLTSRRQEAA